MVRPNLSTVALCSPLRREKAAGLNPKSAERPAMTHSNDQSRPCRVAHVHSFKVAMACITNAVVSLLSFCHRSNAHGPVKIRDHDYCSGRIEELIRLPARIS